MSEPETGHAAPHETNHVVPLSVYYMVFAALMLLTYVTVEVADHDLGHPQILGDVAIPMNVVVALLIAVTKATLVVLFFMHVKYSPRLTQLVVAGAIVWLLILILITVSDYATRGYLGNPGT